MPPIPAAVRRTAFALAVVLGTLPPLGYWCFLGKVTSVSPEEAKRLLADPSAAAVLVDVRPAEEFRQRHLDGAENWPLAEVEAIASAEGLPERLRGKRLLMLCESGITSALAAGHLRKIGVADAVSVHGGRQSWIASAETPCPVAMFHVLSNSPGREELPARESTLLEQAMLVVTGFFVKPAYSVLSLALVVVLWRRKAADLAALRWAMLCFFVGENCCAANYLACDDRSYWLEYLHCYGMALCFALTTFALLEAFDHRLLKFSDPQGKCAALGFCRRCIKYVDVPCGLKRTFLFLIPAAAVLCGMPLTAPYALDSYNTRVFGTFYNLGHPVVYQVFEVRYLPAVAIGLFATSLAALLWKKGDPVLWSKLFFAAGVGALGFSLFRMVLLQSYRDALAWFSVWEEVTEMLFIAGAALVLWLFRHGLFATEAEN